MPSSSIRGRINRNIDMSKLQQQHVRRQDSVMGSVSGYTNSRRSSGFSSDVEPVSSAASEYSMDSPPGFLPIQQPTEDDYRDWTQQHYEPTYVSAMQFMWIDDAQRRRKDEKQEKARPAKPIKHISQAARRSPPTSAPKKSSKKSSSTHRSAPTCPTHIPSAYYQPSIDKGPGSRLGDRQPFSRAKRPSALNLQYSNGSTVASVATIVAPSRSQVTSPSLSLTATKAFAKYKRSLFGNNSQASAYATYR